MKKQGWLVECATGVAAAATILVAGCTTTGTEPAKKETVTMPAKPAPAAKQAQAPKPAAPAAKPVPPPPPAKPQLAMPQVENPVVAAVQIPPFDWQNAAIAPVKRADVLAEIEKEDRPDEFDRMIQVTDMDGKQLAGFLAATNARIVRLTQWENGDKGKRLTELKTTAIPAVREGADEAKLKALVVELKQLEAEYGALRVAVRALVMGVMTLDQQRIWAGHAVMGAVGRGLRGVTLDESQKKKALAICTEVAKGLVKEDTVAKDPYLGSLRTGQEALIAKTTDRVKTEVLTKEQRNALTPKN